MHNIIYWRRRSFRYLTGIVLLVMIPTVHAADIVVIVKERGSGVFVEGATVVLDKGSSYDDTSQNGQVTFEGVASPSHLKILAPGFETYVQKIHNKNTKFTIYLTPLVVDGEGLQVTADRLVEKTSKLTLSTNELIKSAGSGGDPLKALSALPGIIPTEEGSAEVYMRGSNGNENIIWVNNAPVGYLYHFGGFQSTIHPGIIQDINVYLGGFPVEYGDALGGVIDARLRIPASDRMRYKADISTITSSFLVEGPVSDAGGDSFFVAGRRSYIDLIFSPNDASEAFADEGEEDPDQVILVPRFYDFEALYHHKLASGYVDSYIFSAGDEMGFEARGSAKSDPQFAGEFREKIAYQTAGSTWQQQWNKEWDSIATAAIYHTTNSFKIGTDENGESFYANSEETLLHLQPELRWRPRVGSEWNFGFAGGYGKVPIDLYISRFPNENDPNFDLTTQKKYRVKQDLTVSELSPYIKYRKHITQRLVGQLGLRYTNIVLTGGFSTHKLSPRSSLEYQLRPDTLLLANWGLYIQPPGANEVIQSYGNPSLLVTEAEHRILGIEHQMTPLYSVKAEIYHKPMDNLIVSIDENEPPNNYANAGTGEAYGFDLFIKRRPSQGKIGWLSLSLAKSNRTNEITGIKRNFSGDQPLTLTAVWGQPFPASWRRWDWSVKAQIHSGKPYTAVTGRNPEVRDDPNSRWIPVYGPHNGERLPTYYKVDLRIAREILYLESKLKFYLDFQNVTFAKNIIEYDYGNEYENFDNPTEVTGMGFFPFFGVEMEF
ncbi:MAG: TonB-dependent receptor plug domain-containing protein [Thiohalomonadales bacterium]